MYRGGDTTDALIGMSLSGLVTDAHVEMCNDYGKKAKRTKTCWPEVRRGMRGRRIDHMMKVVM